MQRGLDFLVGPPGFEPGTSCTPSKRASQAAPRPDVVETFLFYRSEVILAPTRR